MVNGGFADNTLNITEKHKHVITKLFFKPDKAMKMSTGNLVGILNSDDIFTDDTVL